MSLRRRKLREQRFRQRRVGFRLGLWLGRLTRQQTGLQGQLSKINRQNAEPERGALPFF
jgi:hypothetical protein